MKLLHLTPVFLLSVILFSCSKEKAEDNPMTVQAKLMQHVWILDSTRFTQNNSTSVIYQSSQQILTLNFRADTYTSFDFQGYEVTNDYLVKEPDKIYFWAPGEAMRDDQYLTINLLNGENLKTTQIYRVAVGMNTLINYYHAQ